MANNTVKYWLNKAKEEGKEWAEAALENAKEQGNLNCYADDIVPAIDEAFSWHKTKQGSKYWRDIKASLEGKKTLIEWFEEASALGAEWAEEAILETKRLRGHERLLQKEPNLKEALLAAFAWYESNEGVEYWRSISRSITEEED